MSTETDYGSQCENVRNWPSSELAVQHAGLAYNWPSSELAVQHTGLAF